MSVIPREQICAPELDMFEPLLECDDIISKEFISYTSDAGPTFTAAQPNYNITTRDENNIIDIENAWFEYEIAGQMRVDNGVAGAGNLITNETFAVNHTGALADKTAILNNGWSMFRSARFSVNDQPLQESYDPLYESYFNLITSDRSASKDAHLSSALVYPANRGTVAETRTLLYGVQTTRFKVKLSLKSLFRNLQGFKATRGLRYQLTLIPQHDMSKMFLTGGTAFVNDNTRIYISNLRLYIPVIKPSARALLSWERPLAEGLEAERIASQYHHYQSNENAAAVLSYSWPIVQERKKINRVFVFLTESGATANTIKDRHVMDVADIQSVVVRHNNDLLPLERRTSSFAAANVDCMLDYARLMQTSGFNFLDSENETSVSFEDFINNTRVFAFTTYNLDSVNEASSMNDLSVDIALNSAAQPYRINAIVDTEAKYRVAGRDSRLTITLG